MTGLFRVGVRAVSSLSGISAAALGAWLVWTAPEPEAVPGAADRFEGRLVLEPVEAEGTVMRLGEDFAYVDPYGQTWVAPAGSETDGASIPRVLYSFVGPPFDGTYLKAAIIHDAYCPSATENWRDVHRVFFQALLRCGVSEQKAKIMYAAVYHFGPRWADPAERASDDSPYEGSVVAERLEQLADGAGTRYNERTRSLTAPAADPAASEALQKELFTKCAKWIERENPSLSEIEDWMGPMAAQ